MVNANNLAGHRERFDRLARQSPETVVTHYVGFGDAEMIGFKEREVLARRHLMDGADVVDIGCGVGRLTRYMTDVPVRSYLGTDIIPEIIVQAEALALGSPHFQFATVDGIKIPAADASADLVCGFSVMTHLLDEEIFSYFVETRRVLRPNGVAVFSFLDFGHPAHQQSFLRFVKDHTKRADVLKYIEKPTLAFFARSTGFDVIEIVDIGKTMQCSGRWTELADGRVAPKEFTFGQSLIYLRAI